MIQYRVDVTFDDGEVESYTHDNRDSALTSATFAAEAPSANRVEVIRLEVPCATVALWRRGTLIAMQSDA